ncbi:unnamed protein product [Brassica rapa subsp. narinosa]
MPDCVVVFDAERKSSVILEAAKLQIPVVAIVDPNVPLKFFEKITYPVPARDSVKFVIADEDGDRRWGHGQGLSCLIDLVMSNKPIEKASIDFAEFLTEADPLIVSLPLKFSSSGAVLNVPKGVGTDSNEGFDLSRMKRPMLRLHNPHLKNKIRGRSRYWKELVLTKGFGEKLTKSQAKQIAGTLS